MSDQEDLDLLLSLEDRVLETPPASPSSHSPDYLSDDERPKRVGQTDMSVFRVAVQDCLDYDTETAKKALKSKSNLSKASNDSEVEKFSGLRIRNQLVSPVELSNRFSDIRFVRLPAIKNLLSGDTLSGCWATVGVLTETGQPRTSSTGKPYAIWKMGCLKENNVSVFLFGDAYQRNSKEKAGAVFALFNCGVRNDNSKTSEKYSVTRTELKGGNLRTAFRGPLKSEGIYMVDPLADKTNLAKNKAPVKLFSAEQLKEALSKAGKVTTNAYSQGIRFLNKITEESISSKKISTAQSQRISKTSERISLTKRKNPTQVKIGEVHVHSKRSKSHEGTDRVKQGQVKEKMIELDIASGLKELPSCGLLNSQFFLSKWDKRKGNN
nr:protein MCM10 homolog [Ipomoea batatas]